MENIYSMESHMRAPGQFPNENQNLDVNNQYGVTLHSKMYTFLRILVNRQGLEERDEIETEFLKLASYFIHEIRSDSNCAYAYPLIFAPNG